MKTRTAACAALLALAVLTGCSSDNDTKADVAACETAMREQLQQSIDAGDTATPDTRPSQCDGVDNQTLQKLAGDLMTEQLGKTVESALPSPTGLTADCRAWIESELLDSSESIDATPGYNACGDMSDEELDAAIEAVTNDLLEQDAPPAS